MEIIGFFSKRAFSYLKYASDNYVIDFFDIEVQRILCYIGFSYKKSPHIIKGLVASLDSVSVFYDIDTLEVYTHVCVLPDFIAVSYECFK